jgi:hypothetical protein
MRYFNPIGLDKKTIKGKYTQCCSDRIPMWFSPNKSHAANQQCPNVIQIISLLGVVQHTMHKWIRYIGEPDEIHSL